MASNKNENNELDALKTASKDESYGNLYIFHGEERYLLDYYLGKLRKMADKNGLSGFNHKRFDGKSMKLDELSEATEALPVFADRTLVEVHDYNIFKAPEEERETLGAILNDLPEYVCLVFVYDTMEFSPDKRLKTTQQILKKAHVVEFEVQSQSELTKWVRAHYKALGKQIRPDDAEYLAFITGGLMNSMLGEIEKTAAYSKTDTVTREDIDAVVTPVLDAVSYKLTDAVASGDFKTAAKLMDELLQMREAPHKLMYGLTLKMRQLHAAKVCADSGRTADDLMKMCGLRYPFQAKTLMSAARGISAETARMNVIDCAEAALRMNSGSDEETVLGELLVRLADRRQAI